MHQAGYRFCYLRYKLWEPVQVTRDLGTQTIPSPPAYEQNYGRGPNAIYTRCTNEQPMGISWSASETTLSKPRPDHLKQIIWR